MNKNSQARSKRPPPRLYIDSSLTEGARVDLTEHNIHYLVNVLRMKQGEPVRVFNGADGEWLCHLILSGKKQAFLIPEYCLRPQESAPDLVYIFAPLKQARLDYMVQKAVEMGAGVLQPVLTEYTQLRQIKLERVIANAIEAAEQCELLTIPQVQEMRRFDDLIENWNHFYSDRHLIFCDERQRAMSPANQILDLQGQSLAVLIGPEGGFSQNERDKLHQHPAVTPVSLGHRILRADTAAVAALAVIQSLIGDWNEPTL